MRYTISSDDLAEVEYVGFDLDGTLYDEFEFISQVYKPISRELKAGAYEFMLNLWIEKGSSYNRLFSETFDSFSYPKLDKETFIRESLKTYRNFTPSLRLPARSKFLLDIYKKQFKIFLITDGNSALQRNKFKALGLDAYFNSSSVVFTGDYGNEYYKPHTMALDKLEIDGSKSLFIGDRGVDEEFAFRGNMKFRKVYNLIPR